MTDATEPARAGPPLDRGAADASGPALPRIAVLGSCVTQEALRAAGMPLRSLAASYARLSLASLTAPSPETPLIDPGCLESLDVSPAVRHWLGAELAKTALPVIAQARPDLLLIDLAEERFDLFVLPTGLVLNASLDLCTSGLLDRTAFLGTRRVPRLSTEAWDLWQAGLARFATWAEAQATCRIVLHRFRWANRVQDAAGRGLPAEIAILPGQPVVPAADHDALLARLQDRFLAMLPRAELLAAPSELCRADPDHRWGLGPLHFVPAYHAAVAEAWDRLLERVR